MLWVGRQYQRVWPAKQCTAGQNSLWFDSCLLNSDFMPGSDLNVKEWNGSSSGVAHADMNSLSRERQLTALCTVWRGAWCWHSSGAPAYQPREAILIVTIQILHSGRTCLEDGYPWVLPLLRTRQNCLAACHITGEVSASRSLLTPYTEAHACAQGCLCMQESVPLTVTLWRLVSFSVSAVVCLSGSWWLGHLS